MLTQAEVEVGYPLPWTTQERRQYLEVLVSLPPSSELRQTLEGAQRQLESAVRLHDGVKDAQGHVYWAQERLDDGEIRDQLATARPPGCWCLGIGGRGRASSNVGVTPNDDPLRDPSHLGGRVDAYAEYCGCESGQAYHEMVLTNMRLKREQEVAARIRRQWEASGVPARFRDLRLETHPLRHTSPQLIRQMQCSDLSASWYLHGLNSVGKTGLAVGMAHAWLERNDGGTVMFRTVPALLDELKAAFNRRDDAEAKPGAEIADFLDCGLLILDDLLTEKPSEWVQERLLRIIGGRHDALKPILFTSNQDIKGIKARLGMAVADRIIEMVGPGRYVEVTGPNLRGR